MNSRLKQYLKNLLTAIWALIVVTFIALDKLLNAISGGDPEETISSRMGKIILTQNGAITFPYVVCKFLSLFDKRHCIKSIDPDEGSDQVTQR